MYFLENIKLYRYVRHVFKTKMTQGVEILLHDRLPIWNNDSRWLDYSTGHGINNYGDDPLSRRILVSEISV